MAEYTAEEMAVLHALMANARKARVTASSMFALGQKLKVPCKLQPHIREGMTGAEKNEALDEAMQKYVNCLISHVP